MVHQLGASMRKQVLILGSGFGGLYTALGLKKKLARDRDVQITLVNRQNFSLLIPMLHEVAASDLDMTHIVNSFLESTSPALLPGFCG